MPNMTILWLGAAGATAVMADLQAWIESFEGRIVPQLPGGLFL